MIHFAAQFVGIGQGFWNHVTTAISVIALESAGIAFLISVSGGATDRRHKLILAAVVGVPVVVYSGAVIFDITARSFYYAVIALASAAVLLLIWNLYRRVTRYVIGMWLGCLGISCGMAWAVARGKADLGRL